jgi:HSP20 family protein
MSLIKRDEGNRSQRMPTLFSDFFTRDLMNWNAENPIGANTMLPAVNIKETEDNFEVEMAAPGFNKDDFKIELDGNILTISVEKEQEDEQKEGERYTRREFRYQTFSRSFQLPKDVVDEDKIEAKYENGVLRLAIPKKEQAKQKARRMINIA